jgi:hypothetical protein
VKDDVPYNYWRWMEELNRRDIPLFDSFEDYAALAKRIQEKKLQLERDMIYGNTRVKPMEKDEFVKLWGEE